MSKTKGPRTIVGAGGGEKRRALKLVKGQRGSGCGPVSFRVSGIRLWRTDLERIFPPEERFGGFVIQRDALDDSQCLYELRCDGFGIILSVLWIRGKRERKKVETRVLRANHGNEDIDSRSKFDPLLNSISRYPVAEVIQMRSLDGTVYEQRLAEQID